MQSWAAEELKYTNLPDKRLKKLQPTLDKEAKTLKEGAIVANTLIRS